MPPHPLTNFEIKKHYQNKPKFRGAHSENNFTKRKDGAYVINLDEYRSIGSHCIASYVNGGNVTYFDSFGVDQILKGIKKFIDNKISQKILI